MTTEPVLIAGAGIAGLTAAIALARAGVPVLLVERAAGFSETGAGIQLSPNATSVLVALGLSAGVARQAVAPRRLDIRRWAEPRAYAGMAMQDKLEADNAPFWCLRRADVQTALLDAARMTPGLKLLVGRRVTAVTARLDGVSVSVETERGQTDMIDASVVIGADGLWSAVRTLTGDRALPRFLGYEAWRTVLPAAAVEPFARAPSVNLWLGRAGHVVHYPVDAGKQVNLVLIRNGRDDSQEWSRPGDPEALKPVIEKAAPTLRALVKAAPSWQVWSLFDRSPAAIAKGRVVLIGDAAHPVLPFLAQGAGLAIEDAGVLAGLLAPAFADARPAAINEALAAFANVRRARVAKVQDTARTNGRMYHAGFPLSTARDIALGQLGSDGMRKRYGWLYGWRMRGTV